MAETVTEKEIDRKELAVKFKSVIAEIRGRRQAVDEENLKAHAAWIGVQTYSYYESEFKHFIPAFRRTIEKTVTRVMEQLMPHAEFYNIFPGSEMDDTSDAGLVPTHRYMDWLLTDHIKIRRVVKQLVRTYLLYARCIVKNTIRLYDFPKMKMGKVEGSIRQIWPTSRAVDPFAFYIWPETASNIEDSVIAFEDVVIPFQEYQEAVAANPDITPINQDDLQDPVWPESLTQRLDRVGMTEPKAFFAGGETDKKNLAKQHFVQLSELYFKGAQGRWLMGWLVWNIKEGPIFTRLQFNRYPRPPYRLSVARELPSEHYTPGMGQDIESLQVLLNDQFNQGEEARAVSSGPPVILDPARVKRADTYIFGYRRKWYGDPAGVQMLQVPDTSQSSLRALSFTLAYMEGAGPSPLMQGQTPRGMPRGSQAVSQLMSMAGADLVDIATSIEEDVLTPTIQDLYDLTVAFTSEDQILAIPGAEDFKPIVLSMNEVFGGYHFKWAGSKRFQDKQADAQQAMLFMQNLMRMGDTIAQEGWKIDWATATRVLWKDIIGERRLANIITRMTPEEIQQRAQMMQMMMQAQGGGPTARPKPGPQAGGA